MKKIVVKIGTSSLTNGTNKLSRPTMVEIARQLATLHLAGNQVTFVCSGAIAAGKELLPISTNNDLPPKQMLASIGQVRLMQIWTEFFGIYGVLIGQVLLTKNDITSQKSYQNAQNTLSSLFINRVLPIINENDTVATEEITVGDNDNLSAMATALTSSELLILLTDQEGVYTADPRLHPEATLIPQIDTIDEAIHILAQGSSHPQALGRGGMKTKIEAAKLATEAGATTVIASAKVPNVLLELAAGKSIGTLFPKKSCPQKT